jgi:hypothetical protein
VLYSTTRLPSPTQNRPIAAANASALGSMNRS